MFNFVLKSGHTEKSRDYQAKRVEIQAIVLMVDTLEENEFELSLQHFLNYLASINETPIPSKCWQIFFRAWLIDCQRI